MHGEQSYAEDFFGFEKMMQVGTGILRTSFAITVWIKYSKILFIFRFFNI